MSEPFYLSVSLLLSKLTKVVDWYVLGLHLNIPKYELDKIQKQFLLNEGVERCKAEMLDMWLKKEEEPHWRVIVDALEKMKSYELAWELRDLHLDEDESQSTDPNLCDKEDHPREVNPILVEKQVVKAFSRLESKFAKLVTDIQFSLQANNVPLENLCQYVKKRLNLQDLARANNFVDLLDNIVRSYYSFLNISLIENIIDEFLDDSPVQVSLQEYERELDLFKSSTKMEELVDTVVTSVQKEKGTAMVVLKLEGCWLNVTLERFQQLVEEIFSEKSQCLHLVRVERGCVSIQWTVSECVVSSLVSLTNQRTEFMKYVGVIRLTIDDVVVFKQESNDITSLSSLFIKAIECCSVDVVRFLLSIGVDPNTKDDKGYSILLCSSILACDLSNRDKYYTIIDALLNAGADPNVTNNVGRTPLLYAMIYHCPRIVKLLLDHKADPNIHSDHDYSPLRISAQDGYNEIVSYLLDAGANPDSLDHKRQTPLMLASRNQHTSIVLNLLQHNADPNIQDNKGWTALMVSCVGEDLKITEVLIDAGANVDIVKQDGLTALMIACEQPGNVNTVRSLLKAGANPNLQSHKYGWAAIHFACCKSPDPMNLLALIECGASPDIASNAGVTPLMLACTHGFDMIVEILLSLNVLVNARSQFGNTPLIITVDVSKNINIIQLLLSAGADVYQADRKGNTALDYALTSKNPEITQLLLLHVGDDNTGYRQPTEPEQQTQQLPPDDHFYEPPSHSLITSIDEIRHAIEHPLSSQETVKHPQDEEGITPQQQQQH